MFSLLIATTMNGSAMGLGAGQTTSQTAWEDGGKPWPPHNSADSRGGMGKRALIEREPETTCTMSVQL